MTIRPALRLFLLTCLTLALSISLRAEEDGDGLDYVQLNNGTEIQCLFLKFAPKSIVIAESSADDPDKISTRTVLRADIRKIVVGQKCDRTQPLLADAGLAAKVSLGKAVQVQKEDTAENTVEPKKAPDADVAVKNDEPPATDPPTAKPLAEPAVETLSSKELTRAYIERFPDLKNAALDFAGEQRIQEWLDGARAGNAAARKPIEGLLKAYLATASNMANPTPVRAAPQSRFQR